MTTDPDRIVRHDGLRILEEAISKMARHAERQAAEIKDLKLRVKELEQLAKGRE